MDITSISDSYFNQITTAMDQESKTTESFENVLKSAQLTGNNEEIMNACKEFEAYFVNLMFKEMRKTVPNDGFLKKGRAEEIFQEMLDEKVSKSATDAGGIGLAQFMYRQMTRGSAVQIVPASAPLIEEE